ncbi:MAG: hypothetical protein U0704_00180 [Candidatus Eisenbacteria bacterium]
MPRSLTSWRSATSGSGVGEVEPQCIEAGARRFGILARALPCDRQYLPREGFERIEFDRLRAHSSTSATGASSTAQAARADDREPAPQRHAGRFAREPEIGLRQRFGVTAGFERRERRLRVLVRGDRGRRQRGRLARGIGSGVAARLDTAAQLGEARIEIRPREQQRVTLLGRERLEMAQRARVARRRRCTRA